MDKNGILLKANIIVTLTLKPMPTRPSLLLCNFYHIVWSQKKVNMKTNLLIWKALNLTKIFNKNEQRILAYSAMDSNVLSGSISLPAKAIIFRKISTKITH